MRKNEDADLIRIIGSTIEKSPFFKEYKPNQYYSLVEAIARNVKEYYRRNK